MNVKYYQFGFQWKFSSMAHREVYMALAMLADGDGFIGEADLSKTAWEVDRPLAAVKRCVVELILEGILTRSDDNELAIDTSKATSKPPYKVRS